MRQTQLFPLLLVVVVTASVYFWYGHYMGSGYGDFGIPEKDTEEVTTISEKAKDPYGIGRPRVAAFKVLVDSDVNSSYVPVEPITRKDSRLYSQEELQLLREHEESVLRSSELKQLIEYAHAHYDIPTMKERFYQEGYLIFKPKIPADIFASVKDFTIKMGNNDPEAFKGNWTLGHPCKSEPSTCNHDRYDIPGVAGVAKDWSIRAVIAALYDMNPYSYQSLNYPRSSLAYTHSDYVHFGTFPAKAMTAVWVALEDIHPDSGPLFYYPGSHKLPYYNMQNLGLKKNADGDYPKYQETIQALAENMGYKRESFTPKQGEALIWHGNLLHGGPPPNNPALTRLSVVVHFHFYGMEFGWQPVASRTDLNEVIFIRALGVHQVWGRIPPPEFSEKGVRKAMGASCSAVDNDPCKLNPVLLSLPENKMYKPAGIERCQSGHGNKQHPGHICR
mmetsp:Transcript_1901/g.3323  ORF Transcript_1901/g.3323 Transcript_1901/m.3323 type:complete len:447 (-) Transcript_1901:299-1639(-)